MKMNAQYFIDKFQAIPEENWCTEFFQNEEGQCCANGHCGVRIYTMLPFFMAKTILSGESKALYKVLLPLKVTELSNIPANKYGAIENDMEYSTTAAIINNGEAVEYQQGTPKQRILAALQDCLLLEQQDKAVEEIQTIVNQPDELKELV